MATLTFDGTDDRININPISSSINSIPNGPATIAVLMRATNWAASKHAFGLRGGNMSGDYYHGINLVSADTVHDDDGTGLVSWTTPINMPFGSTADDFYIFVWDRASGTGTERIHFSAKMSAAESWTHDSSDGSDHGNRAGPGTGTGYFHLGNYDGDEFFGDIALIGIWGGTRFSDADAEALWTNKKTSDWYNHSAGTPDTLIEFTTTTPVDIGADPVSTITLSGPTLAGADPTGWDFDGAGSSADSLRFGGSTQRREFSQGNYAGTGAMSFAAIVKRTAEDTSNYGWILQTQGGAGGLLLGTVNIDGSNGILTTYNGTTERQADPTVALAFNEWYLLGISKSSGTTTPRYHVYRYSTSTWEHGNFDGTLANYAAPSTALIYMNAGSENWIGNILIAGLWDSELSDGTFETLELEQAAWYAAAPDEAHRFNITSAITPFVGTGTQIGSEGGILDTGDAPDGWTDLVIPSVTGTASQVDATAENGSTSVTVPSDATGAVAFWSFYHANSDQYLQTLTLGGESFFQGYGRQWPDGAQTNDDNCVGVAYLNELPGTGSQTLAWDYSGAGGARSEGGFIAIVWVKDTNTTSPVRDAAVNAYAVAIGGSNLSATVLSQPGDLVLGMGSCYDAAHPTTTGDAIIQDAALNSMEYDIVERVTSSPTTTVTVSGSTYYSAAAISLQPAGEDIVANFPIATANDDASGLYEDLSGAWPPNAGSWVDEAGLSEFGVYKDDKGAGPGSHAQIALTRFDTSSLPDDATITGAELRLYVFDVEDANNVSLVGDYYDFGGGATVAGDWVETSSPSIFSAVDLGAITTTATREAINRIVFSDLTGINKSGYTGVRLTLSSYTPVFNHDGVFFTAYEDSRIEPMLRVTYILEEEEEEETPGIFIPMRWTGL